jgi:hypothetical protein
MKEPMPMPSRLERIKALKKAQDEANANLPSQQPTVTVKDLMQGLPQTPYQLAPGVRHMGDVSNTVIEPHYACGHKVNLKNNCGQCRNEKRKAKAERNKVKLQAKKAAKQSQMTGRLPDGSSFQVNYHADGTFWRGLLTIPDGPIFEESNSGVFGLMTKLDALYRGWLQRDASAAK